MDLMYLLASCKELQTFQEFICTAIIKIILFFMDFKILNKIHVLQVQSEVRQSDSLNKRRTMGSKAMFKWAKTVTPTHVQQLIQAERDIKKALIIFDSATAEYANGFKHDLNTFSLMISKLISAN